MSREPLRFKKLFKSRKKNKSPGIDEILTKLIKAGGRTILSEITKGTNSIWNKEELSEDWKDSIILPISKRVIKQNVLIMEAYHNLPIT